MYIIIIIIVGAFIWYISRQTVKAPQALEGKSLLKFNPSFKILAILFMCTGPVLLIRSWIREEMTEDFWIVIGMFVFFSGLGYWLLAWSRNHSVSFDDHEIIVVDSIKKEMRFQWSDIKDVQLNTWTSKYILILKCNKKVYVHQYLTGVEDFINRARNAA
jgi:hypothetical protein